MPKLTDPSYFLPVVYASEAGKILSSGRTRPMLVSGICEQTHLRADYVVKLKGSPQMIPGSFLKEILASFIALELDLPVPEPAMIFVDPMFVETMKGHGNYNLVQNSVGINFGSTYITHFLDFVPGAAVPSVLLPKLCELFAFDMMIANADRRIRNNNCQTNGKDLLIFDHEVAFSFTHLLPFATNPQPWVIKTEDMLWIRDNFCFNILKGNNFNFSNFGARLDVINTAFWQKAEALIPDEWLPADFEAIRGHIDCIVRNRDVFTNELNRVLQ